MTKYSSKKPQKMFCGAGATRGVFVAKFGGGNVLMLSNIA